MHWLCSLLAVGLCASTIAHILSLLQHVPLSTAAAEFRAGGQYHNVDGHAVFVHSTCPLQPNHSTIFLHGFPTSSFDYVKVFSQLEAMNTASCVIAVDFLGFGFSDKPAQHEYSIHQQASLIEHTIRELGVKTYDLVAHDYGATVAQELLARVRDRESDSQEAWPLPRRALMLNGGILPLQHRPRLVQTLLASNVLGPILTNLIDRRLFGRSFAQVFGPHTQPSTDELDEYWSIMQVKRGDRLSHKLLHYMADRQQHRERWEAAILTPPVPTLVLNGPADPVSGAHVVSALCNATELPAMDLGVPCPVDGSDKSRKLCIRLLSAHIGHYPQVEAPEAVATAIHTWFQ